MSPRRGDMDLLNLTDGDKVKAKPAKPKRPPIDWERIESEYRAGMLTITEIASTHAISRMAIQKRAKRLGWARDLADKVRKAISHKIVAAEAAVAGEAATIEAAAERGAEIQRSHGKRADRLLSLFEAIVGELERSELPPTLKAAAANNCANGLKTLVGVQRQAFNLDAATPPEGADVRMVEIVIVDP